MNVDFIGIVRVIVVLLVCMYVRT